MDARLEFYYHAFTNKSQGQIILINKTFSVENVKFNFFSTRCIGIRFDRQGKTYNILNCYGPAIQQQRQMFLEELTDIINKLDLDQNNLIVCEDFNMVLHNVKDIISGAAHGHNEVEAFNNLSQVMDLNDCWREMNKETKVFTRSRKEPFVARRLDYTLCGEELMPYVKKAEIKTFPSTDHCGVLAEILEDVFPREPSRWKFNSSHLNDSHYINRMDARIAIFLEEANEENLDKQTTWGLLKEQYARSV